MNFSEDPLYSWTLGHWGEGIWRLKEKNWKEEWKQIYEVEVQGTSGEGLWLKTG